MYNPGKVKHQEMDWSDLFVDDHKSVSPTATVPQPASSPQSALPTRPGTYTRSGHLSVPPRRLNL